MQIADSEIVIFSKEELPTINRKYITDGLKLFALFTALLAFFIALKFISSLMFPAPPAFDIVYIIIYIMEVLLNIMIMFFIIFLAIILILGLFSVSFLYQIQQHFTPIIMRINHEGIFISIFSLLIQWNEIKAFIPFSIGDTSYCGIVPWDLKSITTRAKKTSNWWYRFLLTIALWIMRPPKYPTPFAISTLALLAPVDEFITAIQEHFTTELQEYRITILDKWDSSGERS